MTHTHTHHIHTYPDHSHTHTYSVLWRGIKVDDSVWTMEAGLLTLTLRKLESGWWRCVTDLEGHAKIDSTRCRGPDLLSEYDDAEQEEMRRFFDHQLTRRL
jgi:hypothetical protein